MEQKWLDNLNRSKTRNMNKSVVDTLQLSKSLENNDLLKSNETVSIYDIPCASKGNVIELSIANTSQQPEEEVKVEVDNIPGCLKFINTNVVVGTLKSKEEQTASFTFSVDKTAKVKTEQTINFTITDKTGQKWSKDIKVSITPPMTYDLFQNYPNPFNPTTTIEYQLPGTGEHFSVTLKIYDVIGREVMNLVNEQQEPGYYQRTFNASQLASGMYIYQLVVTDQQNNKHIFHKKMMLLK
jgi:hypothetical protein